MSTGGCAHENDFSGAIHIEQSVSLDVICHRKPLILLNFELFVIAVHPLIVTATYPLARSLARSRTYSVLFSITSNTTNSETFIMQILGCKIVEAEGGKWWGETRKIVGLELD